MLTHGHHTGTQRDFAALEARRMVIPELQLDRTALRGRQQPAHGFDKTLIADAGRPRSRCHSQAYIALGDYQRAIALLERNLEVLRESATSYKISTPVLSLAWLAWGLAEVGKFERALAIGQEGSRSLTHFRDTSTVYTRLCCARRASPPSTRGS